jgi:hypothetical protein
VGAVVVTLVSIGGWRGSVVVRGMMMMM